VIEHHGGSAWQYNMVHIEDGKTKEKKKRLDYRQALQGQ
jgi:hypothetical protein